MPTSSLSCGEPFSATSLLSSSCGWSRKQVSFVQSSVHAHFRCRLDEFAMLALCRDTCSRLESVKKLGVLAVDVVGGEVLGL
jgi:hypothetical protein